LLVPPWENPGTTWVPGWVKKILWLVSNDYRNRNPCRTLKTRHSWVLGREPWRWSSSAATFPCYLSCYTPILL